MKCKNSSAKCLSLAIAVWCSLLMTMGISNANIEYEYSGRYAADTRTIMTSRHGMKSIIDFIGAHPEIFPATEIYSNELHLNRKQRMLVWQTWHNFLDHIHFFDTMGYMYAEVYTHGVGKKAKEDAFYAAFACFLAQYRFAMDFIDRMERNPDMHIVLNQTVPELGIAEDTYTTLKYRFLNVIRGAEFARLNVLYLYYRKAGESPLQSAIEEDIAKIWEAGNGTGPALTAKNALKIVGDLGFTAWFPVQKGVSELMGNIKVWRPGISLISHEQIEKLKEKLRPGDIFLQRREWYATNVGIPGFWTHAALYIGTPGERDAYFNTPLLAKWFREKGGQQGTLDSLLQTKYPHEYTLSVTPQQDKHAPRVLEAIAAGVSFTSLEHSASADSIAVLRPNLPRKSIALAIVNAFHYSGRPYDFNFDFRTDSELVCSELVYKAYETGNDTKGLSLPLTEVLNRPILSPNTIAAIFDEEYGADNQQFTLVTFLDGNEKEYRAAESDVETFRKTWKRPKWHIWLQKAGQN